MIRLTYESAAVFRKYSFDYPVILLRHIFHFNYRACMVPFAGVVVTMFFALYATAQDGRPGGTETRNQPAPNEIGDSIRLTDRKIGWAIDALKEGLYDIQGSKGTWERQYPEGALSHVNAHASGQTTLAVYALLSSGVSYQDEHLKAALDFLASQRTDYTYVRALRAHVWALLPDRFYKALVNERSWLLKAYGYDSGSWNYTSVPMDSGYDNSLTQYGVLGLWEAAKRGVEVPSKLWKRAEDHFLRTQLINGGWNYRPQFAPARGSMTAAGLTCLFITQDFLHGRDYLELNRKPRPEEDAIRKGLGWLDSNFTADFHPGGPGIRHEYYLYYYLYGIERVGLASGYRRFAGQDWFVAGADAIINNMLSPVLDHDHNITGYRVKRGIPSSGNTEVRTVQLSFALLFLSHGRRPIVLSKLRDDEVPWNNRPRDAAHLTSWISDQVEETRSWQILNIDRPMEEWFDGPMVYLATNAPLGYVEEYEEAVREREKETRNPKYTSATKLERIKRYLELGGLLITSADGKSQLMTDSVRELAKTMFPDYTWRKLPEDHWAYRLSAPVEKRPVLYGLTNGVRDLMIHIPTTDAGASLQTNDRKRYRDIFATLANIYYYASERGQTRPRLAPKLFEGVGGDDGAVVSENTTGDDKRVSEYRVWRGVYEGLWNPEPAADELLRLRLQAHRNIQVDFRDVPLNDLSYLIDNNQHGLLWVRGTSAVSFSEKELQELKRFVDSGGLVFFETVGGVGDFGQSAERAVRTIYPGKRFRRISGSPVVSGEGLPNGENCSRVTYRLFSLDRFGSRETRVRLRGLFPGEGEHGGGVFVSRDDVSFSLLGQPCWGVSGYVTRDAEKIMGNLIEFASVRGE